MPQVMTGGDIDRAMRRIAHEILETHRGAENLLVVGIHTRGVHLATQLANYIGEFENCDVPIGALDVSEYRDDLASRQDVQSKPTDMPVRLEGNHVVVVDDVLYTGRTIRAALDALTDLGRALTTELAVLVDRGHRELPIRADYVGKNLPTSTNERVHVKVKAIDGESGVWIERILAA
jgi:pyrimidine operon attenuation protein/uracil phosphoribosyltransferase